MQNYWKLYLVCEQQQLYGPVNYRDFRETGPWYEQHGGLVFMFVFRASYRKKIEFWCDQCSHGHTAFSSYVLDQIALYLQKVICGKNKTSLVHVRLLSGIGSGNSAIFEHKNVHTMHFLFLFKLLLEKRGGGIFGDHNLPSGDQKFIPNRQLAPVLKSSFRTLLCLIKQG